MTVQFAPVMVFAYRRPHHLQRCLLSLAQNREAKCTELVVFCDGAKSDQDEAAVEATRVVARDAEGFATVRVIERPTNFGLARSIVAGVTEQLRSASQVIVVEDDLRVSPHFLRYMNDGLQRYVDEPRVASIHAYCYPLRRPQPAPFFLRGADCWGWATWHRAWSRFEADPGVLLDRLREQGLSREFDFNRTYPYSKMLHACAEGRSHSWAIKWYASAFLADMLTLYPNESLVVHEGNDGTGTNFGRSNALDTSLAPGPVVIPGLEVAESPAARREFQRYFRRARFRSALERLAELHRRRTS